jgi:protein SCO1/2
MKAPFFALMLLAGGAAAQTAMPFDVGGAYELTDQNGHTRTQVDPEGLPQLMFFGYANCPGICSAALPLMADVVDDLAQEGIALRPVVITVDPARDTVETMGPALREHHPSFVGLTGSQAALDTAYSAFSVTHKLAYEDPEYGPVYSHGSLIYLMDADGKVLTLIPPILAKDTAVGIARKYVGGDG